MTKKKSNTKAEIHELHTLPDDLTEIWELSSQIKEQDPNISEEETEQALNNVLTSLKLNESRSTFIFSKIAVAATVLLGASTLFLNTYKVGYEAPAGEQLTLTLSDDSEVTLNGNSRLSHSLLFGITNRNIDLDGEAYFKVTSSETPFKVSGSTAEVTVHGTEFNVMDWATYAGIPSSVMVYEGKVSVNSRARDEVYLTANEAVKWDDSNSELYRYSFQSEVTQPEWLNGELVFTDLTLSEFFGRLEVHFGKTIQFEASRFETEKIEARYSGSKSLSDILSDVSIVKDLSIEQTRNGYKIR